MKICADDECVGCAVCAHLCPNKAISMEIVDGFYYPVIDNNFCTECGLCNAKCPVNQEPIEVKPFATYAVRHKDDEVVSNSASGGAFTALADTFFETNKARRVCVGAQMNSEMRVVHGIATESDDIKKFRDSKYVQSDLSEILPLLREYKDEDVPVLFTGTPCQIAAINSLDYIGVVCYVVLFVMVFQVHKCFRFILSS